MTVKELYAELGELIFQGHGDLDIETEIDIPSGSWDCFYYYGILGARLVKKGEVLNCYKELATRDFILLDADY